MLSKGIIILALVAAVATIPWSALGQSETGPFPVDTSPGFSVFQS